MSRYFRPFLLLLTGIATAACGDDSSGPTGPTRAQVAGNYAICQLTFVPQGALGSVDIAGRAFSDARAAQLRIDPTTAIQLAYTPSGAFVERTLNGTYSLSGNRATLQFTDAAPRNALLLPAQLPVTFQATPRQLSVQGSTAYSVPRADYARLSGQSEANLAPQIQGQLTAVFRSPSCG